MRHASCKDFGGVRDIRKFGKPSKLSGQSPYWLHTENVEGKQTVSRLLIMTLQKGFRFVSSSFGTFLHAWKMTRHERWFAEWVITKSCRNIQLIILEKVNNAKGNREKERKSIFRSCSHVLGVLVSFATQRRKCYLHPAIWSRSASCVRFAFRSLVNKLRTWK